jgi:hypothetical protein
MRTNSNITIYNKFIDSTTRSEKFQRTQIVDPSSEYSVVWSGMKASSILGSGGNIAANSTTVFIPFARGENYLEPKAWQALETKTGYFTFQIGDFVVKGLIDDEITDAVTEGEVTTPAFTITDLKKKYDNVLSVSSVSPMDNGSFSMRHWQLGCK